MGCVATKEPGREAMVTAPGERRGRKTKHNLPELSAARRASHLTR